MIDTRTLLRGGLLVCALATPEDGAATDLDVPGTYLTIAAALAAATSGDVVRVQPGAYNEWLFPTSDVTIVGVGGSAVTHLTRSGVTTAPIISVSGPWTLTLQGFDIDAAGHQAINALNGDGALTLEDVHIRNGVGNYAHPYVYYHPMYHPLGGAVAYIGRALVIRDCSFVNNQASVGGALYVWADQIDISNSTFEGNQALIQSGAGEIFATLVAGGPDSPHMRIANTLVRANVASAVGGLRVGRGVVTHSAFVGNTATGSGIAGALLAVSGPFTLARSAVVGNSSTSGPGGVVVAPDGDSVLVHHSIFGDNSGSTGALELADLGYSGPSRFQVLANTFVGNEVLPSTMNAAPAATFDAASGTTHRTDRRKAS